MVKRLVLIPHQRSFHREKWVWMRAGMRVLTPPAASNRSNTDTNHQSNFAGESSFAIFRMDSQCVKIGLTYQVHSFPSRASLVWKEKIGLLNGILRDHQDDTMVGDQPTGSAVWSGREDLNLRHPAPKAGALPGCATPRRCSHNLGLPCTKEFLGLQKLAFRAMTDTILLLSRNLADG